MWISVFAGTDVLVLQGNQVLIYYEYRHSILFRNVGTYTYASTLSRHKRAELYVLIKFHASSCLS
jgi:hypothetical protein